MNLAKTLKSLKQNWKILGAIGTWITVSASALIIPMPDWTDLEIRTYTLRLITFIASVLSAFLIIYSRSITQRKLWLHISVLAFLVCVFSYIFYLNYRADLTLPYAKRSIVIGTVEIPNNPIRIIETRREMETGRKNEIDKADYLKIVHGKSDAIWTEKSIAKSRTLLISSYAICYLTLAIFMVSFASLITFRKREAA